MRCRSNAKRDEPKSAKAKAKLQGSYASVLYYHPTSHLIKDLAEELRTWYLFIRG